MKNVKHAKCVRCGRIYAAAPDLTSCACGGILDIVYDYDYIRSTFTKDDLAQRRDSTMWRFRELLPVEEDTPLPPLRVGGSPLYEADALAQVGAVVLEEERADVGRALTALIGRDEIPDEAEILAKNCGKE